MHHSTTPSNNIVSSNIWSYAQHSRPACFYFLLITTVIRGYFQRRGNTYGHPVIDIFVCLHHDLWFKQLRRSNDRLLLSEIWYVFDIYCNFLNVTSKFQCALKNLIAKYYAVYVSNFVFSLWRSCTLQE